MLESKFNLLTLWIFDKNKCKGNRVRWQVLMPEFYNNRFEKSSYGCNVLAPEEIWKLNERTDREPRGRAIFKLSTINELNGLSFEPDEPPSFHGNVIGWSDEKDARMEIAQQLSEESDFKEYPN